MICTPSSLGNRGVTNMQIIRGVLFAAAAVGLLALVGCKGYANGAYSGGYAYGSNGYMYYQPSMGSGMGMNNTMGSSSMYGSSMYGTNSYGTTNSMYYPH